jgi:AraC-like DNA-binding protein
MEAAEENTGYISERISIPAEWVQVFTYFYYAANRTVQPISKKLLPTFQTILVFNFGHPATIYGEAGALSSGRSIVLGPLKKVLEYELPTGSEILVVNFRFDAFYRFFGAALKACNELVKNPDELIKTHCFSDLWQELNRMLTLEQRVQRILDFSVGYLHDREAASETIIRDGLQDTAMSPVKVIAEKSGQSERSVQLNYKKYLGYSAKEMSRYQRFQKTVHFIQAAYAKDGSVDWFDVIDDSGYYDQSHLIHDFTHYLGISPTQFLKLQADICMAGS